MHAGRQDGEAKYIWLDWLKYEQNRGNRVSYVYLCVFVNSLKKKKKEKKKNTSKTTKQTQYICASGTVQQVQE